MANIDQIRDLGGIYIVHQQLSNSLAVQHFGLSAIAYTVLAPGTKPRSLSGNLETCKSFWAGPRNKRWRTKTLPWPAGRFPNAIYFVEERRKPCCLSAKNTGVKPEGSRAAAIKTTRLGANVDRIGRYPQSDDHLYMLESEIKRTD